MLVKGWLTGSVIVLHLPILRSLYSRVELTKSELVCKSKFGILGIETGPLSNGQKDDLRNLQDLYALGFLIVA